MSLCSQQKCAYLPLRIVPDTGSLTGSHFGLNATRSSLDEVILPLVFVVFVVFVGVIVAPLKLCQAILAVLDMALLLGLLRSADFLR